ncbi:MAG TPA: Gfo/Idh/MocA family oxidoreductase [Acidobacteriota bacterium]|nr:Gfo/Idh/MocA family oxidoreductase [Acidobacteriota bacterium]
MLHNVAVVGCGYWGPNLVRNFHQLKSVDWVHCVDLIPERLDKIQMSVTGVICHTSFDEVLKDDDVTVVAIATPLAMHYKLAKAALQAGKHVLIEKPMAPSLREAEELVELADKKKLILMVDHTFLFTQALIKIKEMIDEGHLGELVYFDSNRINLGLFQHDSNVVWDLATHDISIIDRLFKSKPVKINCTGTKVAPFEHESIAYLSILMDDGSLAHISVNWMSPVKVRQILIGGTKRMLVFDDVLPSEKVKVYDKGVEFYEDPNEIYKILVQYRVGDMHAPKIGSEEALALECQYLLDCVDKGQKPFNDGVSGARVVAMLEAAQKSLELDGATVRLD